MTTTDRLDTEVLSALRSLSSGFPSLARALQATERFLLRECNQQHTAVVTQHRLTLLVDLNRVLNEFEQLGIPTNTLLRDIPLLLPGIIMAERKIQAGHGFTGLGLD